MLRGRIEAMPAKAIYLGMEKGDSYVKDVLANKQGVMLDDIPKLISVLGLKLVSRERICITPEERDEYEACKTLARRHLAPPAQSLTFEDPE